MQTLALSNHTGRPRNILCLGAHSDDIEIGCGGTILKLVNAPEGAIVHWVVFAGDEQRAQEARIAADRFLQCTRARTVETKTFADSFFPYMAGQIKEEFRNIRENFAPDIVFTHFRSDLHQDHRLISELTWNEFRDHLILEFEIPKYDGDLGSPNVFVPLDAEICERKVEYIFDTFQSQRSKRWFMPDTFLALMRLRGMECNSPSKYAEAFYCRKVVL